MGRQSRRGEVRKGGVRKVEGEGEVGGRGRGTSSTESNSNEVEPCHCFRYCCP